MGSEMCIRDRNWIFHFIHERGKTWVLHAFAKTSTFTSHYRETIAGQKAPSRRLKFHVHSEHIAVVQNGYFKAADRQNRACLVEHDAYRSTPRWAMSREYQLKKTSSPAMTALVIAICRPITAPPFVRT